MHSYMKFFFLKSRPDTSKKINFTFLPYENKGVSNEEIKEVMQEIQDYNTSHHKDYREE